MAENINISDFYFELIAKELSGEISEQEKSMLLEWVNKEQGNRIVYEQAIKNWNVVEKTKFTDEFNTDDAWSKIKIRTGLSEASEKNSSSFSYKPFLNLRVAASVLLLIGMFVLAKVTLFSSPEAKEFVTKENRMEIYLPDSSKVMLNQNSHLTYYSDFNSKGRKVHLQGEAFFEVRKAEGKKFEVIGSRSITTVLGTSFLIRSTKDEESVQVVTGRVSFADKNELTKNLVILTPGFKGAFDQFSHVTKKEITELNFMAWKDERLVFDNTTLSEVKKELEKYFDLQIEVIDPLLLNCRFTGTFDKPTADQVLEVLAVSTNLSYKIVGDKIILTGSGCTKN